MATTVQDMNPAVRAAPAGDPLGVRGSGSQSDSAAVRVRRVGGWSGVSPNAVVGAGIAVFVAVIGLVGMLLVAQLTAISDGIGRLDARIDSVETNLNARIDGIETKLDAKIDRLDAKIDGVEASLRTEMQAGFAQINAVLLDHTDRLARLEAHAGLAAAPPAS